ncbi:MAG: acyltransferase family protein [Alphaproteobacteria bacterium]|nr:acyltransferase family protein [Alphaproteobacteria bacterium]
MTSLLQPDSAATSRGPLCERFHALDAVRAGALLLGVVFHASVAYLPGPPIWFVEDTPSDAMGVTFFVSHMFRMVVFFLMAGFFARMSLHRLGLARFLRDRAKRILLPLIIAWPIVFPSIIAIFIWSAIVAHGELPPGDPPPMTAETFPLTHLWFLYDLVLFYVAALLLRGAVVTIDRGEGLRHGVLDRSVGFLVARHLAPIALAIAPCIAFALTPDWRMWFGVPTPDTGLVPNLAAISVHFSAFGFGWILQRQPALLRHWEARWAAYLAAAIALTVFCLFQTGIAPIVTPAPYDTATLLYAGAYSLAIWCWTFGLVGLALRFLSAPSRTIRYIADASYWVYLVHLPIVMALQVLAIQRDWPWPVEVALVLAITFTIAFVSYHLFVRNSAIGAILNGRRRGGGPARQGVPAAAE